MTMRVIMFVTVLLLLGCKEERLIGPYGTDDSIPGKVTGVKVERTPGGARISYVLPLDKNLLYVKAVYSTKPGEWREEKASFNANVLNLNGFPDTSEYAVQLFSVSKKEKVSEPVHIEVKPLLPPVRVAFQSMVLGETFGGVNVKFDNPSSADLVMTVLTPDSTGIMTVAETVYTKARAGTFSARGYDTTPRTFGVFFRDRWDNYSDTLYAEVTPLFEEMLDKTKFRSLPLPTDNWMANPLIPEHVMERLWDGLFGIYSYNIGLADLPQAFTFSLGDRAQLSRFIIYPNTHLDWYAFPREFEFWGSNDPNPDGSWDSWEKLGSFEIIKPSGLPSGAGNITQEDREQLLKGFEFEFPDGVPPVKYLRFRTISFWGGVNFDIQELDLFGRTVSE